jgi:hypothetical protein
MAKSARDEQIFVSASSARSVVFPLSRTLMRPHYLVMIRYGSLGQPRAEGCRRWDKGRSMTGDRVRWRSAQHVSKTRHESCQRIRRRSRFLPLLVVGPVLSKPRQADQAEKNPPSLRSVSTNVSASLVTSSHPSSYQVHMSTWVGIRFAPKGDRQTRSTCAAGCRLAAHHPISSWLNDRHHETLERT